MIGLLELGKTLNTPYSYLGHHYISLHCIYDMPLLYHYFTMTSCTSNSPGGDAKPGAKLAQTIASGIRGNTDTEDDMSSRMGRERIPESSRKGYQSGGRGNYFAGQTAAEKEADNKRKEAQKRAKETDKMSAGGGDRRRDLEAKLSPQMRNSALAKQQEQDEEELESRARRSRAVISRKFSRPVERVLKVYNSDSTDLYDVLQVSKEADDGALKKAYRSLALSVHPGMSITALLSTQILEDLFFIIHLFIYLSIYLFIYSIFDI